MPLETLSVHPMRPLYEACRQMLKTRARRIPLVDVDDETGREMVVSVITQYRILKFIAVNVDDTELLKKSVSEIGLGTYGDLQTANMDTSVIDVIHMMVKYSISSVPIVDEEKRVLNVFEAVDVISCIKGGAYDELTTSVGEALGKRSDDFAGIYTCSEEDRLDSIFHTIRKSRVHRLVVIDDENRLKGTSIAHFPDSHSFRYIPYSHVSIARLQRAYPLQLYTNYIITRGNISLRYPSICTSTWRRRLGQM